MLGSSARDVHAVALKLATQLGLGERPEVQMAFAVAAREALSMLSDGDTAPSDRAAGVILDLIESAELGDKLTMEKGSGR